jgi:hypothetical protein
MPELAAKLPSAYAPRQLLLVLALFMNFRIFQFFPGAMPAQEAWFLFCFLACAVLYPFWKLRGGLKFTHFELYLLAAIAVACALPALSALSAFGQPLLYGLLAQRSVALVAGLLLLLHAIRSRSILVADLERALLTAAWASFWLFSAMQLLLDPARFSAYQDSFVLLASGIYTFRLPSDFLLFGVIYYTLRGFRTRSRRDYVLALVLFVSIVGINGSSRMLTLSLLSTCLIFLYRWRTPARFFLSAMQFSLVLLLLLGVVSLANPQFIAQRGASFSSAFEVALGGSQTEDRSANMRLFDVLAALPNIQKHPAFGNGALSHQWQGGVESYLGDNFHDSDIGVLGIVFTYGVFGLLFFAYQYRYALRAARALGAAHVSPLADAAKGFLVFSAIDSLTTGAFVFNLPVTLFFILVLNGIAFQASYPCAPARKAAVCTLPEPA